MEEGNAIENECCYNDNTQQERLFQEAHRNINP